MTQTEQDLYHFLRFAENANGMNAPAFRMLAEAVEATGKLVGQLTLAELADIYQQTGERYNARWEALNRIEV